MKHNFLSRVKREIVQVKNSNLVKRHDTSYDVDKDFIGPYIQKKYCFQKMN